MTPSQTQELRAACVDVFKEAMGAPEPNPHPLARAVSVREAVSMLGRERLRPGEAVEKAFAHGLSSSDFGFLVASAAAPTTLASYASAADHLAWCTPVNVRDFRPTPILAVEDDVPPLEPLTEFGRMSVSVLSPSGASPERAQLRSFGCIAYLSRQLVINGDMASFLRTLKTTAAAAARQEQALLAAAMETNPAMSDGQPVFDAQFKNLHGVALDAGALGKAVEYLRTQPTAAGQPAGLAAAFVVAAPDIEFSARKLVHESGLNIAVHGLAGLPAGRWFLLADPDVCPAVGVLRLGGTTEHVRVEALNYRFEYDAMPIRLVADLGCTWLRRTGVVRGGV